MRIRAGQVGVEHRFGDGIGVGIRQPAGAERVGHVGEYGAGRDTAGVGVGLNGHEQSK